MAKDAQCLNLNIIRGTQKTIQAPDNCVINAMLRQEDARRTADTVTTAILFAMIVLKRKRMNAQWIKYTGSQEQLEEIRDAPHGWIVRWIDEKESSIHRGVISNVMLDTDIKEYLICSPLPHASMIARHAMTGQPVEAWSQIHEEWMPFDFQFEKISKAKLRFSYPKEEKKFVEFRTALVNLTIGNVTPVPFAIERGWEEAHEIIKWIDPDWRRVEV